MDTRLAHEASGRQSRVPGGRQPGQVLVLAVIFPAVLLMLVGTAVDYGLLLVEEQNMQIGLDAASLAGARALVAAPRRCRERGSFLRSPNVRALVSSANLEVRQIARGE